MCVSKTEAVDDPSTKKAGKGFGFDKLAVKKLCKGEPQIEACSLRVDGTWDGGKSRELGGGRETLLMTLCSLYVSQSSSSTCSEGMSNVLFPSI